MDNILPFTARAPKPIKKKWVGPIEAERARCIAVLTSPAAQGVWAVAAQTMLTETAASAQSIIEFLKQTRASVHAEWAADIATGTL